MPEAALRNIAVPDRKTPEIQIGVALKNRFPVFETDKIVRVA